MLIILLIYFACLIEISHFYRLLPIIVVLACCSLRVSLRNSLKSLCVKSFNNLLLTPLLIFYKKWHLVIKPAVATHNPSA